MDKRIHDGLRWYMDKERIEAFDKLVGGIQGSLVLDTGARDGSPLADFLYEHGAQVIALDKSTDYLKKNPHPKVQANVLRMPIVSNSVDIIVCQGLFCAPTFNQKNLSTVFQEIVRVLKPGSHYLSDERGTEKNFLKYFGFTDFKEICSKAFFYARKP